jgi:hypothetical protein
VEAHVAVKVARREHLAHGRHELRAQHGLDGVDAVGGRRRDAAHVVHRDEQSGLAGRERRRAARRRQRRARRRHARAQPRAALGEQPVHGR